MIPDTLWKSAQKAVAAMCEAAHRAEGCCYTHDRRARQRRRHRAYTPPALASAIVDAMGKGDAEAVSALLIAYRTGNVPREYTGTAAGY